MGLLLALAAWCGPAWPATVIYRSVGPGNTSPLATGSASNQLTVSGSPTVATFTAVLPDRVGVGDVIIYDASLDGTPDHVAFIQGRTDATHYAVRNAAGGDAFPTAMIVNTWFAYRAYTSLGLACIGTENTGILAALRDFDPWFPGKDIVTSGEQWNLACYADAEDATDAALFGWTTSAANYVRVFTPVNADEVGTSQRHHGAWDTGAYRLTGTDVSALTVQANYARVEGLQIRTSPTNAVGVCGIESGISGTADLRISDCIISGRGTPPDGLDHIGLLMSTATFSATVRVWNNLIYGFQGTTDQGMNLQGTGLTAYVYNNTVVDCYTGIYQWTGSVTAKNDLTQACTDGFSGTFTLASDYNLSDLAGDAPGANSKNSTTVAFQNAAGDDYHLALGDTGAKNAGTDLAGDANLAFADDIDLQTRPYGPAWDIGADEFTLVLVGTPTFTPTSTPSPSLTPTPLTLSATPTPSASRTATSTSSRTATGTRTVSPSTTTSPTLTGTPTASASPTRTSTATPTGTGSRTPTISATVTVTPPGTSTGTPTVSATPTLTATPSVSATPSGTRTATATSTATHSRTATVSATATVTPPGTSTATPTISATPSNSSTPSLTATHTGTRTATATRSVTPTATVSPTRTCSPTVSATPSISPTPSVTPTRTASPTAAPVEVADILAYPQPATGNEVWFYYRLSGPAHVRIEVYTVTGEKAGSVEVDEAAAGYGRSVWNIADAAPGIYLYRAVFLTAGAEQKTGWKKLAVVKK